MALDKQRLSDSIRDKLINIFMWPTFDQSELEKFCDAISDAVISEFTGNAELDSAALDSTATTTPSLPTGSVDDGTVSGGII